MLPLLFYVLPLIELIDKLLEAGLRWYGHVLRRQWLLCYGRQKKSLGDMMQQDLKSLRLKKEDTGDRNKWRRKICITDPSPGIERESRTPPLGVRESQGPLPWQCERVKDSSPGSERV